jgi:hypothetical protein
MKALLRDVGNHLLAGGVALLVSVALVYFRRIDITMAMIAFSMSYVSIYLKNTIHDAVKEIKGKA